MIDGVCVCVCARVCERQSGVSGLSGLCVDVLPHQHVLPHLPQPLREGLRQLAHRRYQRRRYVHTSAWSERPDV
jgi:hypothetical protein